MNQGVRAKLHILTPLTIIHFNSSINFKSRGRPLIRRISINRYAMLYHAWPSYAMLGQAMLIYAILGNLDQARPIPS